MNKKKNFFNGVVGVATIVGTVVAIIGLLWGNGLLLPDDQSSKGTEPTVTPTEPTIASEPATKPSEEAENATGQSQSANPYANLSIGKIVEIGTYEQDNRQANGAEPIEWKVLDIQNGEALLISNYILFCGKYNETWASLGWDRCSLRTWLNDSFYKTSFSQNEKKYILESVVSAESNPQYRTGEGNDTSDKVFILSISEAQKYLSGGSQNGYATAFAVHDGVYVFKNGISWYWLRSPGEDRTKAAYVTSEGEINKKGLSFESSDGGVRPAIKINMR